MQLDVVTNKGRFYDIPKKIDIVKGEKFSIVIDATAKTNWFFDNDDVLASVVKGSRAEVEATNVGSSILLVMDDSFNVQKILIVNVLDKMPEVASNLNVQSGSAVQK